ncbi:MAG: energy-coupling factor transporter transmembrane component T [Clostridia bacterium]|nr:energy-coupling factor transporter transmembrane component T [Clostridia bacterium]
MNEFKNFHPLVNVVYFALVMLLSAILTHPVCLAVSLSCSVCFALLLNNGKAGRTVLFILPAALFAALINVAFNHRGATILAYFPSGNPFTMESAAYGAAAAAMVVTSVCWAMGLVKTLTSDKIVYLFSKSSPSLSLVLSMTLRFVPLFTMRLKTVAAAQKGLGGGEKSSVRARVRNAISVLSIVLTWSMENAIQTADSMKGRGYSLPNRSAFSIFRFDKRDGAAMVYIMLFGASTAAAYFSGAIRFSYFPIFKTSQPSPMTAVGMAAFLMLCVMPIAINLWEGYRWKSLKPKV